MPIDDLKKSGLRTVTKRRSMVTSNLLVPTAFQTKFLNIKPACTTFSDLQGFSFSSCAF